MKGSIPKNWETHFLEELSRMGFYNKRDQVIFLDYGSGDGRYYKYLINLGLNHDNIYGIEVSKKRVERCKAAGWEKIQYLELNKQLPFNNGLFHIINMVEVIEHIPNTDINFYLHELVRVLDKNGTLIITTPNYPIKRFYDIVSCIVKGRHKRIKDDPTHVSKYTYRKLESLLKRYFNDVKSLVYKEGFLYKFIPSRFFAHKILCICKDPINN